MPAARRHFRIQQDHRNRKPRGVPRPGVQRRHPGGRAARGGSSDGLDQPGLHRPKVTDAGDFIFRVIPSGSVRGKIFADISTTERDLRRLAALYINNEAASAAAAHSSRGLRSWAERSRSRRHTSKGRPTCARSWRESRQPAPRACWSAPILRTPSWSCSRRASSSCGSLCFSPPRRCKIPTCCGKPATPRTAPSTFSQPPPRERPHKSSPQPTRRNSKKAGAVRGRGLRYRAPDRSGDHRDRRDVSRRSRHSRFSPPGARLRRRVGEITFDKNGDVVKPFAIKTIEAGSPRTILVK